MDCCYQTGKQWSQFKSNNQGEIEMRFGRMPSLFVLVLIKPQIALSPDAHKTSDQFGLLVHFFPQRLSYVGPVMTGNLCLFRRVWLVLCLAQIL